MLPASAAIPGRVACNGISTGETARGCTEKAAAFQGVSSSCSAAALLTARSCQILQFLKIIVFNSICYSIESRRKRGPMQLSMP